MKSENSKAYTNMVLFFEYCGMVESCDFYLDCIEICYRNGSINESELLALRHIGRKKRMKLLQKIA